MLKLGGKNNDENKNENDFINQIEAIIANIGFKTPNYFRSLEVFSTKIFQVFLTSFHFFSYIKVLTTDLVNQLFGYSSHEAIFKLVSKSVFDDD